MYVCVYSVYIYIKVVKVDIGFRDKSGVGLRSFILEYTIFFGKMW